MRKRSCVASRATWALFSINASASSGGALSGRSRATWAHPTIALRALATSCETPAARSAAAALAWTLSAIGLCCEVINTAARPSPAGTARTCTPGRGANADDFPPRALSRASFAPSASASPTNRATPANKSSGGFPSRAASACTFAFTVPSSCSSRRARRSWLAIQLISSNDTANVRFKQNVRRLGCFRQSKGLFW